MCVSILYRGVHVQYRYCTVLYGDITQKLEFDSPASALRNTTPASSDNNKQLLQGVLP